MIIEPPQEDREELDIDTYKDKLMSSLTGAWDLACKHIEKAQKRTYDRQSWEPTIKAGNRVFVYMPQDKSSKAYKFARPFHGPYRVMEVLETGVVVCPVGKPDSESIRVAWNRVCPCPNAMK